MTTDDRHGMVTAARREAAAAGSQMLEQGGNAVDAAVATAFALTVVDPANTGVGGYGGFMVVGEPASGALDVVDFNTAVPEAFDAEVALARAGGLVTGGAAVSVPRVVPGLAAAQSAFGRLPLRDVIGPAVRLAAEGFDVDDDLARSLQSAARERGLTPPFVQEGRPLRAGERLVQHELSDTLRELAERGPGAFTAGPLVDAMCDAAGAAGGTLSPGDFVRSPVTVTAADRVVFEGHTVAGPPAATSGSGVLFHALAALDRRETGEHGGRRHLMALADSLRVAWRQRLDTASVLFAPQANTTHSCAADADGMLVAVTHTHGLTWFGSGIVVPGTGIVLNAGANSFARERRTGTVFPMTNMAPVVVFGSDVRLVLGTPGGARIPAIVLQALVDVIRYGLPLDEALRRPRLAVALDGRLEVEPPLQAALAGAREIATSEFYGPANGIAERDGLAAALDPRFACAVSPVAAHRTAAST